MVRPVESIPPHPRPLSPGVPRARGEVNTTYHWTRRDLSGQRDVVSSNTFSSRGRLPSFSFGSGGGSGSGRLPLGANAGGTAGIATGTITPGPPAQPAGPSQIS